MMGDQIKGMNDSGDDDDDDLVDFFFEKCSLSLSLSFSPRIGFQGCDGFFTL